METLMLDAFERFRAAVARHQPLHETVRSDHAEVLVAADDILRGEARPVPVSAGEGWTPPDHIRLQLAADRGCSLNETIASDPTRVDGKKRHQ